MQVLIGVHCVCVLDLRVPLLWCFEGKPKGHQPLLSFFWRGRRTRLKKQRQRALSRKSALTKGSLFLGWIPIEGLAHKTNQTFYHKEPDPESDSLSPNGTHQSKFKHLSWTLESSFQPPILGSRSNLGSAGLKALWASEWSQSSSPPG